jgi:hypothetical protein
MRLPAAGNAMVAFGGVGGCKAVKLDFKTAHRDPRVFKLEVLFNIEANRTVGNLSIRQFPGILSAL